MASTLDFVAALEEKHFTLAQLVVQHDAELKALLDQIGKLSPAIGEEVSQRLKQAVPDLVQSACNEYSLDVETRCKTALADAEAKVEALRAQIVELARERFTDAEKALGFTVADVERRLGESLKGIAGEQAAEIERGLLARIASELSARSEKVALEQRIQLIDWFRGEFKPGTEAKRGEVWTFVGSTFLALDDTNELPTRRNVGGKSPRWALLAARGSGGGGGGGGGGDSLPSQAGNAGKYLTTDGSVASWAALAGGGDLLAANNLSDLANAATARTNLGLGDSATKNVGTTAGTVAAGDDARLTDARTPTAHASSHQNGGSDEISVAGLSGELADPQTPKNHDHSSNKLAQANTHESADTDAATTSLHHTLGTGANQAAAGNHTHTGVYEPVQTAASQAEMEAGTETAIRSMTPQRVAQAIAALATGTKTLVTFEASDLQPPASNYHAFDTRTILAASFRDTTADDSALLVKRMPEGANLASGVTVYFEWVVAGTATSGNVIWQIDFARLNENNQDLDSITFDTATTASASAANGTAGKLTKVSVSIAAADLDGITAGDLFIMRITRLQSNGSDTLADKAMILGGEIRSAA